MNAQTKHAPTPGPWHVDSAQHIRSARGIYIGEVASSWSQGYMNPAETNANARLIAAAPELLEALRAMVDNYTDTYGDEGDDAPESVKAARAAISKAGGAA